jgi:hypothetical protein
LQIFREKRCTTGLVGSANDERVLGREIVQPLKIAGGQDVTNVGLKTSNSQQFDLSGEQPEHEGSVYVQPPQNILAEPASRQHHYHCACVLLPERGRCAAWLRWLYHRCRRAHWCKKNYERSWVSSRLNFQATREWPRAVAAVIPLAKCFHRCRNQISATTTTTGIPRNTISPW